MGSIASRLALLVVLAGCDSPLDCLPHDAAPEEKVAPPRETTAKPASVVASGRYVVVLDRSAGMSGFVRDVEAKPGVYTNLLRRLPATLLSIGGSKAVDYFGLSQEKSYTPPAAIGREGFFDTIKPQACDINKQQAGCGKLGRHGRVTPLLELLWNGQKDPFRLGPGDLVVLVSDLQPDEPVAGLAQPAASILKAHIEAGRAVGLLGVVSRFNGVVNDLPGYPKGVPFQGQQPFFLVLLGAPAAVTAGLTALEPVVREVAGDRYRRELFALTAEPLPTAVTPHLAPAPGMNGAALFPAGSEPARRLGEAQVTLTAAGLQDGEVASFVFEAPQSADASRIRTVGDPLPDGSGRLWAFYPRLAGNPACESLWSTVEGGLAAAPGGDGTSISLRLPTGPGAPALTPGITYYTEQRVLLAPRNRGVQAPAWVKDWSFADGGLEAALAGLKAQSSTREVLGVGDLATVFNILAQAGSGGPRRAAGAQVLRLAFRIEGGV